MEGNDVYGFWIYDPEWGYLWTRDDSTPYLWREATGTWMYFLAGEMNPVQEVLTRSVHLGSQVFEKEGWGLIRGQVFPWLYDFRVDRWLLAH